VTEVSRGRKASVLGTVQVKLHVFRRVANGRTGWHACDATCVQGSGGCPCGLLVVAAGGCVVRPRVRLSSPHPLQGLMMMMIMRNRPDGRPT
jgi:hypothetical protein